MSDRVQLIKQELERIEQILDDFNKTHNNTIDNGIVSAKKNICKHIKSFIDSLPEEPTKEDLEEEIDRFEDWINNFNQSDYPTSYTVRDIARHFAEWGRNHFEDKSEMVSEDLENAAIAYSCANPSERSDGMYDQTDIEWAFEAGAEWQKKKDQETIELAEDHAMLAGMNKMKEEMMENAVDAAVHKGLYSKYIKEQDKDAFDKALANFKDGDKVKIIIVKEEQ